MLCMNVYDIDEHLIIEMGINFMNECFNQLNYNACMEFESKKRNE